MGVCRAPHRRSQSGRYISTPRAVVMSPRSMTFFHPNQVLRISVT